MRTTASVTATGAVVLAAALTGGAMAYAGAIAVTPDSPAEAVGLGLTPGEWRSLSTGRVVVRGGSGESDGEARVRAAGFIIIGTPWTAVFDFVANPERQLEYSRCTKAVEIVSRESRDGQELVKSRETHKALWISMRYTLDFVGDAAAREIRWTLDPQARNDVKDNAGSWRFIPLNDGRTLLAYSVAGIPGKLPRFLLDFFVRKDLPAYLAAIRSRVEATKSSAVESP